MDIEGAKLTGNLISVTAHGGRNDRSGLVSFTLLSLLVVPVFLILPLLLFGGDDYGYDSSIDYQSYEAIPEPTQLDALLGGWLAFVGSILIALVVAVLMARFVLSKLQKVKVSQVSINRDAIRVKEKSYDYAKIKGVKVQPLVRFGGVIFGFVSLIIVIADKIAMFLLGPILPASMKRPYDGQCFSIMLEYGKLGLPQVVPIGVFYDVDKAIETAELLQAVIAQRQSTVSVG